MSEIEKLIKEIIAFRDARNWKQFHNAKDLAMALSIESAELLELFLWKSKEEFEDVPAEKVKEELADILIYSFLLADEYDFNIIEIMRKKLLKNEGKYPVDKARGNARKYNEF